jgi:hypothetical protein
MLLLIHLTPNKLQQQNVLRNGEKLCQTKMEKINVLETGRQA